MYWEYSIENKKKVKSRFEIIHVYFWVSSGASWIISYPFVFFFLYITIIAIIIATATKAPTTAPITPKLTEFSLATE